VCNNLTAEWSSPENGWRFIDEPLSCRGRIRKRPRVGGRGGFGQVVVRMTMKGPPVQILVVVAAIQTSYRCSAYATDDVLCALSLEGRSG